MKDFYIFAVNKSQANRATVTDAYRFVAIVRGSKAEALALIKKAEDGEYLLLEASSESAIVKESEQITKAKITYKPALKRPRKTPVPEGVE